MHRLRHLPRELPGGLPPCRAGPHRDQARGRLLRRAREPEERGRSLPDDRSRARPGKEALTTAFLLPGRVRETLRRHPWVYRESVSRIEGDFDDGDVVRVAGPDGKFVAHAFANERSRLFLRLVSFREDERVDPALLKARVRAAAALRDETLALPSRTDAYRVVHSEADGLPGLIVDRAADVLVLSCTSLGTQRFLEDILSELEAIYRPRAILELGKALGLRAKEGLPEGRGWVRGSPPEGEVRVRLDGALALAPLEVGQKTGLFLDQRDNVRRTAELASGRSVLDACCYGGAFAIAALRAGAARAELFDSSERACELARKNLELNALSEKAEVRRADLYPELRRLREAGKRFSLVVLDPPKFASSKRDLPRARKGYTDANAAALRLLEPGGLLVTCSCSHHVSEPLFEEIVREAAALAAVDLQVLERRGAGPDHPTDVFCPEGRYLQCFIARVRP
ncbi:class I SAM-dependent rRNA methyltransferase [bacterium]|nr:class I SAM-dependent rRNA methyltransferase [bacterium]